MERSAKIIIPNYLHHLKKFLPQLGILVSVGIVCIAFWILSKTLHSINYVDVIEHLYSLSGSSILIALLITTTSYWVITGYDVVALRHIRRKLPYRQVALSAFVASTFGNTIGFSILTGTSVRYRIYSQAGLSALEIAGISTLCALSTILGMSVIFSVSMLIQPTAATDIPLSPDLLRVGGGVILSAIFCYLVYGSLRPISLNTTNWNFRLPSTLTALSQIVLATTNLCLIATLIYILLPANQEINYIAFLGVFAMAIIAGSASNVPGGIGVFESVLLLGFPTLPAAGLLGAILVFRCIYYLSPLCLAGIAFAAHEARQQPYRLAAIHAKASDWLDEIGPQLMAVIVLLTGMVLLLSGVNSGRYDALNPLFPLFIIEIAHLLAALAGLALIIVARGISRRLNRAYIFAGRLMILGIVAALVRDYAWYVAALLFLVLILIGYTRDEFHRKAKIRDQGFPVEWSSVLYMIIVLMIWLGIFVHKPGDYTISQWFYFDYNADYSRYLRSCTAVVIATFCAGVLMFLRRDAAIPSHSKSQVTKIKQIIKSSQNARASQALDSAMQCLFSPSGNAFLMYKIKGRNWIAYYDPVGAKDYSESKGLLLSFREMCDRFNGNPVFFLVDKAHRSDYLDLNMTLIKLGFDARVSLENNSSTKGFMSLREDTQAKTQQIGLHFKLVDRSELQPILPALQAISEHWRNKNPRQNCTSVDEPIFHGNDLVAVAYRGKEIIGFAGCQIAAQGTELLVNQVRYLPDETDDILQYLYSELMNWGRENAYQWCNLGLVPLLNTLSHPLEPLWERIGFSIFPQSEHFEDIRQLRSFVERFKPRYRSKYLALSDGRDAPRVLTDISKLIV